MSTPFTDRFALTFEPEGFRRTICGQDVIIHCHHYNSRVQHSVESASVIDGKSIVVSAAEAAFVKQIQASFRPTDEEATQYAAAAGLYAHLGYGQLDFSQVHEGVITAPHSHFVAGWNAGFPERKKPVCSLTEGYLQATLHAVTGASVFVREVACRVNGSETCRFEVDRSRETPITTCEKRAFQTGACEVECVTSEHVDEKAIIDALVAMPIHGNAEGLIPAFNVYLANTPADFYNLVSIGFLEAMRKVGLEHIARSRLISDAEFCGINTFRGIMASPEWDALVGPMLKAPGDELFGIVAVSNALGWGNWHITEYEFDECVTLVSSNGYEAEGQLGLRGVAMNPSCLMLTGVAAGIMALVHGEGTAQDRIGQFESNEAQCRACRTKHSSCSFTAQDAA